MRRRFVTKKGSSYGKGLVGSIAIFLVVLFCFWAAVSTASEKTVQKQEETLETALSRSITNCYAIEGRYPESLDYLKKNYGLTYNEDLFFVDYQPLGMDIIPDVTVIARKGGTP